MIEGSASYSGTAALSLIAFFLAGGLLVGAGAYVERIAANANWHATLLDSEKDAGPTRLQLAVESTREIRAALAKPLPPPEPLQPITAKLARGHLVPGHQAARTATARAPAAGDKVHKLPKAALNAMASAKPEKPVPAPLPDIHRVY